MVDVNMTETACGYARSCADYEALVRHNERLERDLRKARKAVRMLEGKLKRVYDLCPAAAREEGAALP